MADTLSRHSTDTEHPGARYRVVEVHDRRWLEARLSDDRAFSAYALGHLDLGIFEWTRFWHATGPAGDAVVMHSSGLGPTTVVTGAPEAAAAILALHPGAARTYLSTASPEHRAALAYAYHLGEPLRMMRMSLTAASLAPEAVTTAGAAVRLHGSSVDDINALYASEGGPSHYSREAIDRAIYYGVVEGGRVVAVAGTHVVSPEVGIAVVGNVFTHPAHRGRGYATLVTSAVTRDLIHLGCAEVVLTVDPNNAPALAAYTKIGYRPGPPVIEARLRRRDLFGVGPALRRWSARRRGRPDGPGIEIVTSPLATEGSGGKR